MNAAGRLGVEPASRAGLSAPARGRRNPFRPGRVRPHRRVPDREPASPGRRAWRAGILGPCQNEESPALIAELPGSSRTATGRRSSALRSILGRGRTNWPRMTERQSRAGALIRTRPAIAFERGTGPAQDSVATSTALRANADPVRAADPLRHHLAAHYLPNRPTPLAATGPPRGAPPGTVHWHLQLRGRRPGSCEPAGPGGVGWAGCSGSRSSASMSGGLSSAGAVRCPASGSRG